MASGLRQLRASTDRLAQTLQQLDDTTVAGRSLLPGWTRAMVLTHLARNADAFRRVAEAAGRGGQAAMDPHGAEGRDADIAAGAGRGAAALARDVLESASHLEEALGALDGDGWAATGAALRGSFPVSEIPGRRRREVEVHHADLGLAYGPSDWPADFVADELGAAMADLPGRVAEGGMTGVLRLVATGTQAATWTVQATVPPTGSAPGAERTVSAPAHQLLAWLLGRPTTVSDAPVLGAWR